MPRPPIITDAQILAAALEVFLERGIRATTAEVARRAGVAEGSLFNRFKTKEELFHAAMHAKLGTPEWAGGGLAKLVGEGDLRDTLETIGLQTIAFFEKLLPVISMMMSNPSPEGPPHLTRADSGPQMAVRMLSGYFEAEMLHGRLRRLDAEIVARSFLGSLWHYAFFETMVRSGDRLPMPRDRFVRGLVQMMLEGVGAGEWHHHEGHHHQGRKKVRALVEKVKKKIEKKVIERVEKKLAKVAKVDGRHGRKRPPRGFDK